MAFRKQWSFSVIKDFETCPRKYHEEKVLKNYPFVENEAARYGNAVHKAAENYILHDTPLGEHERFKKTFDRVKAYKGEIMCEQKWAVSQDAEPVKYFDKSVWFRAIGDFVAVNGSRARILDWKTGGAKYPDLDQLEVMALATWVKFPEVEIVDAALVFLVERKFFPKQFKREKDFDRLWKKWDKKARLLDAAHQQKAFPPKPNGLCRQWCPVQHCEYNGD